MSLEEDALRIAKMEKERQLQVARDEEEREERKRELAERKNTLREKIRLRKFVAEWCDRMDISDVPELTFGEHQMWEDTSGYDDYPMRQSYEVMVARWTLDGRHYEARHVGPRHGEFAPSVLVKIFLDTPTDSTGVWRSANSLLDLGNALLIERDGT